MKPLLMVMNPRAITRCLDAIAALRTDKVYLVGYTERQLVDIIPDVVERAERSGYTHLIMVSDDCVPTNRAYESVVQWLDKTTFPVVTGFCPLDDKSEFVNLTHAPFMLDEPKASDYRFLHESYAKICVPLIQSYFAGFALTGMSVDMWKRYPFQVWTTPNNQRGSCSDWMLAKRLQRDGIKVVAPHDAYVEHVKRRNWVQPKSKLLRDEHRLLIGEIPAEVVWVERAAERLPFSWQG